MIGKEALINKYAILDSSVQVGPYTVIEKGVKIGKNVKIGSNVVITGDTTISDGCEIYPFACIGTSPQHLRFKGEETKVFIGKDNVIREFVTINRGTEKGGGVTTVGNKCSIVGKLMKNCGRSSDGNMIVLFDSNNKPHVIVTYLSHMHKIKNIKGQAGSTVKEEYQKYLIDLKDTLKANLEEK